MKKVDESIRDQILDLIVGKGLTISEFALEKDFIVTEVLHAVSRINNSTFDLVFCGGTCLSKAYGLLERISEDADIKVVPKGGVILSPGQRRSKLSQLKKEIIRAFVSIGFLESEITYKADDGNTYVVFNAEYSSHFEVSKAMRASMRLELNFTTLSLASVNLDIGFLYNQLAGIDDSKKLKMPCVNIKEALAEKLISFPRRLALHLSNPVRFKLDKALVRHIFDVNQILAAESVRVDVHELKGLLATVMDKDAKDFATQFPNFLIKPIDEILNAMKVARSNELYRKMYEEFLSVMVYGKDLPTFDESLNHFEETLKFSLPPQNTDYLNHNQM